MRWVLVVMAALCACVQSNAVTCGDYVCPAGNVCVTGGCATPEEAAACSGAADGTPPHDAQEPIATTAAAIAARISGVALVTLSLRRSTILMRWGLSLPFAGARGLRLHTE